MKLKNLLTKIRNVNGAILQNQRNITKLQYDIKHDALIDKIFHCQDKGVSNTHYADNEVIVSLTTYGKRIYDVAVTIESIMQGSIKPNRIALWLDPGFKDFILPVALQRQLQRGLEIHFYKDIRSYKKLIPSLMKWPDAYIITIDDDAIYQYDCVEKLVNCHTLNPECIIANRVHRIVLGQDNKPIKYLDWQWEINSQDVSPLNFATGVGGTLYPPQCFDADVFNESDFMGLCKYADDIWFNAMALKKGTHIKKCPTHSPYGKEYIMNPDVQDMGLFNINLSDGEETNDSQLKAVFNKYNLWDKLLENY